MTQATKTQNTKAQAAKTQATKVKVSRIIDGDTVDVLAGGGLFKRTKSERLRLYGIDAPESNQQGGTASTNYLAKLIRPGSKIWMERAGTDQYGRTIALLYPRRSARFDSFNHRMIRAGHAWAYMASAADRQSFAKAEDAARRDNIGLWRKNKTEAPWTWRRRHRQRSYPLSRMIAIAALGAVILAITVLAMPICTRLSG